MGVLSVVAQQIHTIQHAVANNIKSFQFEGVELSLNASCSIFITMNTMSYADRGVRIRIFDFDINTVWRKIQRRCLIAPSPGFKNNYEYCQTLLTSDDLDQWKCSGLCGAQCPYWKVYLTILAGAGAVCRHAPGPLSDINNIVQIGAEQNMRPGPGLQPLTSQHNTYLLLLLLLYSNK